MPMFKPVILFILMAFSAPAQAHPHVFIDAGLCFLFDDQGQLAAVRMVWAYDEFYSLLMVEENQLDSDGDGTLSAAELQALAGNDVAWDQGFPGDLELRSAGGDLIELGRPLEHNVTYENGRIIRGGPRCLVPQCGGLLICDHQKETLWDKFYTAAPRTIARLWFALRKP